MMFINPAHDFFVTASKYAKKNLLKELNYLEAELIMLDEEFILLQKQGIPAESISMLENKVGDLKNIVRNS